MKKPDFLMFKGPNNEVFDPKTVLLVKKTLKVSDSNGLKVNIICLMICCIDVFVFVNR